MYLLLLSRGSLDPAVRQRHEGLHAELADLLFSSIAHYRIARILSYILYRHTCATLSGAEYITEGCQPVSLVQGHNKRRRFA